MSHKILFTSFLLALCCASSFAQDSMYVVTYKKDGTKIKAPLDSFTVKYMREANLRERMKPHYPQGNDKLIGMHIDSALKLMSNYTYEHVSTDHYPFVKEAIAISGLRMWDIPVTEYLFVDESNTICRIHYRFWNNEVPAEKVKNVGTYAEILARHPLNANWDLSITNFKGIEHFFMYQKGEKGVRPAYSVTTEEFKTKLLDYAKDNSISADGIFTESVELFSDK